MCVFISNTPNSTCIRLMRCYASALPIHWQWLLVIIITTIIISSSNIIHVWTESCTINLSIKHSAMEMFKRNSKIQYLFVCFFLFTLLKQDVFILTFAKNRSHWFNASKKCINEKYSAAWNKKLNGISQNKIKTGKKIK